MLKTVGNTSTRYGDQTIVDGNLVIGTASKGIDFSADGQAAGMTSELLDDYEEGTFTPTISALSGSYTTVTLQAGKYTKVGRMVRITATFRVDDKGTGSVGANITGLPFAMDGDRYAGAGWDSSVANAYSIFVNGSTTTISVFKYDGTDPIVAGRINCVTLTYFV